MLHNIVINELLTELTRLQSSEDVAAEERLKVKICWEIFFIEARWPMTKVIMTC